jgi:hypothetical protein
MKPPSVRKEILILLAGTIWSITGLVLIVVAISWSMEEKKITPFLPLAIGIVGGIIVGQFGFSRLSRKNIRRISDEYNDKKEVCLFAFQSWRSYLIILIMVTLGYILRHSFIPHIYLSPIYMAIGLGLLIAGFFYFKSYSQKPV